MTYVDNRTLNQWSQNLSRFKFIQDELHDIEKTQNKRNNKSNVSKQ